MNSARALVRTFSSSAVRRAANDKVHPGYQTLRAKMFKYQIDDGVPIYLKGGTVDRFLFATTLGLCGVGLCMCFEFFYTMSFPKKV